jgi:hypothetical protein
LLGKGTARVSGKPKTDFITVVTVEPNFYNGAALEIARTRPLALAPRN